MKCILMKILEAAAVWSKTNLWLDEPVPGSNPESAATK